jgi:MFS family permease
MTTYGSLASVVAAQLLLGAGVAFLYFSLVNLAHESATAGMDSTAQTLMRSLGVGAGGAIGQTVAGYLMDLFGVQRMYGALAVGAVLIVVFGVVIHVVITDSDSATPA